MRHRVMLRKPEEDMRAGSPGEHACEMGEDASKPCRAEMLNEGSKQKKRG